MTRALSSTFASCSLLLAACASVPIGPAHGLDPGRTGPYLESLAAEGFAGQLTIVHGVQVLKIAGYGVITPDSDQPVDEYSVMPLASITKAFAASAILALAAEGRLGLEEPVGRFLPDLAPPIGDLSLHALMTHTAGLPAEIVNRAWSGEPRFEPVSLEEFLSRIQQFEPDSAPGANFSYSNLGYNLLAAVVESVAEEPWESYLTGTLLRPAGIEEIGLLTPDWDRSRLVAGRRAGQVTGHYLDQPQLANGAGWQLRGAGDLLASPAGIIAWWQSIRDQRWLSMPWQERWLEPQVREPSGRHYGYGLEHRRTAFGPMIGHTGSDLGFSAQFSWLVDHDLMVHVASADDRFPANELAEEILRRLLAPR